MIGARRPLVIDPRQSGMTTTPDSAVPVPRSTTGRGPQGHLVALISLFRAPTHRCEPGRCAEERLALFLLNLADRYRMRGYSPSEFVLRMTREEIASYLGLKLETVSRLFSRLQEVGRLQVQGRTIKLLDLVALEKLVGQGG